MHCVGMSTTLSLPKNKSVWFDKQLYILLCGINRWTEKSGHTNRLARSTSILPWIRMVKDISLLFGPCILFVEVALATRLCLYSCYWLIHQSEQGFFQTGWRIPKKGLEMEISPRSFLTAPLHQLWVIRFCPLSPPQMGWALEAALGLSLGRHSLWQV